MTDSRRTETTSLWSDGQPVRAPIGLLAPGTALADRYEVREVLGHGGFAVVYLAHDRELGRDVALKVLREDRLTPGALSRLKREVRVARDLAHENLVRVYDIETSGPALFITLEAVPGGSLRDQLRRGPLPVEVALRLALGLLRGLQALHGVGIVHRDVKPGNVLLTEEGGVKLADFGLALHLEGGDTRVTATETAVGTLEYLSPEQALGETVDARSDLYSAGVVLFEMLAGRLPHDGRSSLGNLIARFRERPPNLAALRPDTPRWLARVVARLLARDRAERYPTAAAVLHDLERRRAAARPSRHRRRALAALALAALIAAAATHLAVEARGRRFSHVSVESGSTVIGVDHRGRTLWRHPGSTSAYNFVELRPTSGRPALLAATLGTAFDRSPEKSLRLHFLDPQTGATVDRMDLPNAAGYFPGFAPTYGASLAVTDLDGDGSDELVASYLHSPYWPSFSVLVEPATRRAHTLLVASGHHLLRATVDLDGDGTRDLLFAGVNNRTGWRVGVAAVRALVRPGAREVVGAPPRPAVSADRLHRDAIGSLIWYAVGPRRLLRDDLEPVRVAPEARLLTLEFQDGSRERLDFDGFDPGSGTAAEAESRQIERREAYFAAAEASRLLESDRPADALRFLAEARSRAGGARDRGLEAWLAQLEIEASALAGSASGVAEAIERALRLEPDAASEAYFTAARSWHRAGELEHALAAYTRSESQPGYSKARGAWETLEGKLFALVELGRHGEARRLLEDFQRSWGPGDAMSTPLVEFLAWQSGGRPDPDRIPTGSDSMDLHRYWNLEARATRGEDPRSLLEEIRAARQSASETLPLLDSLEAELLSTLGQPERALALAREALAEVDRGLRHHLFWRPHRALLAARLARLEHDLASASPAASGARIPAP